MLNECTAYKRYYLHQKINLQMYLHIRKKNMMDSQ